MGDPHYRTFDGTYYTFMGNCTYIMAKNCQPDTDHPAFEVWTKNERTGSAKSTSVEMVVITVYGLTVTIVRHQTGLVIINDSLWNLPISLDNNRVNLWQSGLSVVMETDFGLSVQYDWEQYLVVKVSGSFMERMCGMCGNFNGKKNDDLTTPTGSFAGNIPALGKSWRVPGLAGNAYCTDDCTGQCQSCEGEPWYDIFGAKTFCGFITILSRGPLRHCNTLIDTNAFYENCLLDYCMGKGYKNFLCRTAQTYIDTCQRAGIKVFNWRKLFDCPNPQCTANSHFESCGSPCPATCENPTAPATCKADYCVQACSCNEGYIRSGNRCVPKSQCGCVYSTGGEKRYLEANETFWADDTCQKLCTCNPLTNNIDCKATSCPSGQECTVVKNIRNCYPVSKAICNIYGDPHYNTFDNTTYDFQGTCTYTAAQGCHLEGTQLTPFEVVVENEKWDEIQMSPNVSMAKVVVVEVYGMILVLRRNQLHQMMINGILTNIPVSLDDGKVTVQQEGYQNVIATDFGLRVAYDMVYHVSITVPSSYLGKTCGMCGTYNGKKSDELLLPDGKVTSDIKAFGAAWKVAVPGVVCDDGCSGDFCPTCPADKKAVFEKDCSIITNPEGPFAACHSVINPESYFRDCVYDVCMGDGDKNMLCHSIAAYMIDCQNFGVTVKNWRTSTFCPLKCPANSHYEICAQSCDSPCPGLTEVIDYDVQICAEGCMCDSGFFTNGTGCVKADQCSCYENGHTYKIGESIITDDCQVQLTCLPSGEVKHESMSCKSNETCTVKNGVQGCYSKQCALEAGGFFTFFNGETWTFTSLGAFELVKVCDEALVLEWFRVVVQVQACGQTGLNEIVALHVFFEDVLVTVTAEQEIWLNGKKVGVVERNGISVTAQEGIVIINKGSELQVSYSLSEEIIVTFHLTAAVETSAVHQPRVLLDISDLQYC
ncbi:hypothetical protein MHYP_G00312450 [Metynnis hypsauchen]